MNQDERTILPVLPLDDAVVLPGMSVTFPVTTEEQAEALDGAVRGASCSCPASTAASPRSARSPRSWAR